MAADKKLEAAILEDIERRKKQLEEAAKG